MILSGGCFFSSEVAKRNPTGMHQPNNYTECRLMNMAHTCTKVCVCVCGPYNAVLCKSRGNCLPGRGSWGIGVSRLLRLKSSHGDLTFCHRGEILALFRSGKFIFLSTVEAQQYLNTPRISAC